MIGSEAAKPPVCRSMKRRRGSRRTARTNFRDGIGEPSLASPLDVFREPMFQLLIVAGLIYLAIGDLSEALMLLAFAAVNVLIAVYQECKTERVLEALKDLTSPRALVIRGGERRRIPGRELVRGDLIVLNEGDRVPADAIISSGTGIEADESLLTGEAVPVRKAVWNGAPIEARPGGDDLPLIYSGTMLVKGHGIAEVRSTGMATEIGKIGKALGEVRSEPTLLHIQIRRLVKVIAAIACRAERGRPRPLRRLSGTMAGWRAGGHYFGNGAAAAGISARADGISGDGRLADSPEARTHAPNHGNRGAWCRDRPVHRQDRHSYFKSYDGCRAAGGRRVA